MNPMIRVLPEEIVIHILARLPVKPLLRARSVCKLWKNLISSRYLIRLHSQFAPKNSFVLLELTNRLLPSEFVMLDYSNGVTKELPLKFLNDEDVLNGNFHMTASCNGLLCLVGKTGCYYVCNPITREVIELPSLREIPELKKRLPKMDLYPYRNYDPHVGLTYDLSTQRFRVFIAGLMPIASSNRPRCKGLFTCFVFDSYYGQWEKFESSELVLWSSNCSQRFAFVNDCCHWLLGRRCILSLDSESGIWRKILLPMEMGLGERGRLHLMESDGSLFVIRVKEGSRLSIWVMNDYWNEQWRLVKKLSLCHLAKNEREVYPLSLSSEHLIVQTYTSVFVYDQKHQLWNRLYEFDFLRSLSSSLYSGFSFLGDMFCVSIESLKG